MPDQIWVFYSAKVAQCKADFFSSTPQRVLKLLTNQFPSFTLHFFSRVSDWEGTQFLIKSISPLFHIFLSPFNISYVILVVLYTHDLFITRKALTLCLSTRVNALLAPKAQYEKEIPPKKGATHILQAMLTLLPVSSTSITLLQEYEWCKCYC